MHYSGETFLWNPLKQLYVCSNFPELCKVSLSEALDIIYQFVYLVFSVAKQPVVPSVRINLPGTIMR